MKLRALVVEDEAAARHFLVDLLEATDEVVVVAAVEDEAEASVVLAPDAKVGLDIAFVDIHLAGAASAEEAGLRLVRKHAGRPGAPQFVLTTANPEHALEAYDLGVVDYLLKPLSMTRVQSCLQRVRPRTNPTATPHALRVVARTRRGLAFFEQDEVLMFRAADRLVEAVTEDGAFGVDLTLNGLERSFAPRFVRVHRNYLVNETFVRGLERLDGEMRLSVGSHAVSVARDRVPEVRRRLLAGASGIKGSA